MNQARVSVRRVKIVCTLGPASNSPDLIERMLMAGMDIARFNLAHGTLEKHSQRISQVRSLSQKLKFPTGILIDLPGLKRCSGDIKTAVSRDLEFALSHNADFIALFFIS